MGLLEKSAVFTVNKAPTFRETDTTPWTSIYLTGVLAFCAITQFAMFFSSMWPYLQTLDSNITEPFYGYIVGAYSIGSILTSQLFSRWCAKTRSVKNPLITCLFSMAIGNLIYILVPLANTPWRKWVMLFGRFILGFGDNCLPLLQGYASTASTLKDRSRAIAVMTSGLSIGFALAPAIQIIFSPIGSLGWQISGDLRLNMYSAPALTSLILSMVGIALLKFAFVEKYAGIQKKETEKNLNIPNPDKIALLICFLGRYAQFFTFVNLEAIGATYVENYFAMAKEEVVVFISGSHIACGALSLIVYAGYIVFKIDKWVNARIAVIFSFVSFFLFYVITFSWPFLPGQIDLFHEEDLQLYLNGTVEHEPLGCNVDRLTWCDSMAPSNKWIYFFGFAILVGVGWPNINVCLSTILSKVIGPRHQAHYQGIFQMCASAARLTGPISMSAAYRAWGPNFVWSVELIALGLLVILLCIFYNRLVPLEEAQRNKKSKFSIGDA